MIFALVGDFIGTALLFVESVKPGKPGTDDSTVLIYGETGTERN